MENFALFPTKVKRYEWNYNDNPIHLDFIGERYHIGKYFIAEENHKFVDMHKGDKYIVKKAK